MHRVNDEIQLDQNRHNIEDLMSKLVEDNKVRPYQQVFIQECEYMNVLNRQILVSLSELDLAFKGELTMSQNMEMLMDSIFLNKVPASWTKVGFTSERALSNWLTNLKHRLDQLNLWKEDCTKNPTVVWVNRLFNPASFLTAIKQVFSREKDSPLNRLEIQTDILKKMYFDADLPTCREGAYVFGLQIEGARWDLSGGLEESEPKKQFSVVPVVNCKAYQRPENKEEKGIYPCPVYKTGKRGATYVFTAQLKTKHPPQKWILAGVAGILDVEGISDKYIIGKEAAL